MKIVVATFNPDKQRELEELLELPGVTWFSLRDFPHARAPEESGTTLLENALIKARAAYTHTGIAAIADDTGLEVDALGGAPGVHAARYAGPAATYADNVRKLLDALRGVDASHRTARFRTVAVAVFGREDVVEAEGVLEGRISESSRGVHGFGYDPVFEITGTGKTLAEMSAIEKNADSHRARAVRALAERLRARLGASENRNHGKNR